MSVEKEGPVDLIPVGGFKSVAYPVLMCVLVFGGLYVFSDILAPFLLGWAMAYLLQPVMRVWRKWGFSAVWAALALTILTYVLCAFAGILLVPSIKKMIVGLSKDLVKYKNTLWQWLQPWISKISAEVPHGSDLTESLGAVLNGGIHWVIQSLRGLVHNSWEVARVGVTLLLAPVIGFHLMKDWTTIREKIELLVPGRHRPLFLECVEEVDRSLASYVRGQSVVCVLLSFYYAVGLVLVGLKFGLVVGILTGVFSFIPYFGLLVGFCSASLLALFQGVPASSILAIALLYGAGQALEGGVLTPWLIGGRIGLHPVVILFAVFAGASLKGMTGVFLALPLSTILAALWRMVRKSYLGSAFYARENPKNVFDKYS